MTAKQQRCVSLLLLLLAALLLVIGAGKVDGRLLYLGRQDMPRPEMMAYLLVWGFFGTGAVLFGALGLTPLLNQDWVHRVQERSYSRPSFVIAASILAVLIPVSIRMFVLRGAPVADDESAYQFSAELLASGRLYVESPPHKLFFDRAFLINDGRMYTQYFLGWPALMVPFVWAKVPGYANAVYCALTVPGLFAVTRRLCGPKWAPLVLLLYVTSPHLMIAAATQMSHTTCLAALTYAAWFFLQGLEHPKRWRYHAAFSGFFVVAFFIRPFSALGIGLPLLGAWAYRMLRSTGGRREPLIAFAVPAAAGAVLFLTANTLSNGSPLKTAYVAAFEYAQANGFRFSNWSVDTDYVATMSLNLPGLSLDTMGTAMLRLWFSMGGWPIGLALTLFAHGHRSVPWLWAVVVSFFIVHYANLTAGIDAFGPVHYFELALPLLILTVHGAAGATRLAARINSTPQAAYIPVVAAAASMMLALALFVPAHLLTLARISEANNLPLLAPERRNISNAVVFAPRPFNPYCHCAPASGFVWWPPLNDPDLERSVLWVEHVSLEEDKAFLRDVFPQRAGYLMFWTRSCTTKLLPIGALDPGQVPEGHPGPENPRPFFID